MFYSQVLLGKKGPLGTIWVAAVCGMAALKREQIARTDIASSVDKILPDIQTSYRIVAQLLLGIVRIYSKKVDYLYRDCSEIFRAFEVKQQTGPRPSTGKSSKKVVKQVKEPVHSAAAVGDEDVVKHVKEPVRAGTSTAVITQAVAEGSRAGTEIGVTSQTPAKCHCAKTVIATTHTSTEVLHEALCTPTNHLSTITIPKRFELDAFDLEIADERDDADDHHQLANQDNWEEEQHQALFFYESHQRVACSNVEFDLACFMQEHDGLPPEMVDVVPEATDLSNLRKQDEGPESDHQKVDAACFTPVRDVVPPEMMDLDREGNELPSVSEKGEKPESDHQNLAEHEISACSMYVQEERRPENAVNNVSSLSLGPKSPCKANVALPTEERELLMSRVLPRGTSLSNEEIPSTLEHLKPVPLEGDSGSISPNFAVRTPANNERCRLTKKRTRAAEGSGSSFMARTPAKKEKSQMARKRTRVLFDETIVLSNEALRQAIHDASDLVCKRRQAPHTYLDAWKQTRINSLQQNFMDPLVPYMTMQHCSLSCATTSDATDRCHVTPVNARKRLLYEAPQSNDSCKINSTGNTEREEGSDVRGTNRSDELENSSQAAGGCQPELGNANRHSTDEASEYNGLSEKGARVGETESHSVELRTKRSDELRNDSPSSCNEALNAALDEMDEDVRVPDLPSNEECSGDEDSFWSVRTRTIARSLCELFRDQKSHKGKNALSLAQALEGRKRKTSARFFYETLFLKSHGLIEIKQEAPYEDIVISANPQLEAEFRK